MYADLNPSSFVQMSGAPGALDETILAEDRPHLESIRQWIFTHTGLHFGERKQYILYRRLQTLCWRQGIPTLEEMDRQLHGAGSSQLALDVACTISTNHTFFFREPMVLDYLRDVIIPQLPQDEMWRIWSAASSSGEEAYTLAMLLAEMLGVGQSQQRAAILGTDLSHPMVDQAEHGVYDQNRMDQVPPEFVKRYFEPVGLGQWRVSAGLRKMCTFRRINLQSADWPFKNPFHVILCRNVLYYFDSEHQERLVERLYDMAMPGGWLLTSVTETLHGLKTRWKKVSAGVFHRE